MGFEQGAVFATIGLILATAFMSGPLVGAVDLTPQTHQSFEPGTGAATLVVESINVGEASIRKGGFGSGVYYLDVPDAFVEVREVDRSPLLIYKIRIPSLGYARSSISILSEDSEGLIRVSLQTDEFRPQKIKKSTYDAELSLLVRADNDTRVVYRQAVSIEVEE